MFKKMIVLTSFLLSSLFFTTSLHTETPLYSNIAHVSLFQTPAIPTMYGTSFAALQNFYIVGLGHYDDPLASIPMGGNREVGLWEEGVLIASTTVLTTDPFSGGQFRYHSIAPVAITSGLNYVIAGLESSGQRVVSLNPSQWPSIFSTYSGIDLQSGVTGSGSGGLAFPSSTTTNFYANVSAMTMEPLATPEPGTYLLLGSLLGFTVIFRLTRAKLKSLT